MYDRNAERADAPDNVVAFDVTWNGDTLDGIRYVGTEGNVLGSLGESDYVREDDDGTSTFTLAAAFLAARAPGEQGVRLAFGSGTSAVVAFTVVDTTAEPGPSPTPDPSPDPGGDGGSGTGGGGSGGPGTGGDGPGPGGDGAGTGVGGGDAGGTGDVAPDAGSARPVGGVLATTGAAVGGVLLLALLAVGAGLVLTRARRAGAQT